MVVRRPRRPVTAAMITLAAVTALSTHTAPAGAAVVDQFRTVATTTSDTLTVHRAASGEVKVRSATGRLIATFTQGARTVTVRGQARVLAEPADSTATVRNHWRVRLLPRPFSGHIDWSWLRSARHDTSPDVLDVALQYTTGAAQDAEYGPLAADGTRQEGADFNDFLGVSWEYGSEVDPPEADQLGSLDCSGFTRMVFGYRLGVPMTLTPDGVRLPRRSAQMLASAPGVVTIPDTGAVPSPSRLDPGDLLFFDASTDDGDAVDHVGIYLGRDADGHPRFVSSRKTPDGPTMGDVGGNSLLSGTGTYARTWRAARRL